MGANCCVAAKERPQPCMSPVEVSAYRVRHSPSWSFRWDNRTHIEDIMENNRVFSNQSTGNIQLEVKNGFIAPTEGHASGDILSDAFRRAKWQKSDKKEEASKLLKVDPQDQDQPTANSSCFKTKSCKLSDIVTVGSDIKTSKSLPSTPPPISKAYSEDLSSSISHSILMDPSSIRKADQSPGHQLYRQILDGNVPSLKPFNENSYAEIWPSNSMLSAYSNDLFAGRSQGELSVGWTTCTSELVGTSQKDRLSVDYDHFGSSTSKASRYNALHPTSLSPEQGVCKLCSRLLKERSSWNGHELAVVAVLFCGHAYHSNCLDSITAESEKYDPPCPVCTHGETCTEKLFGKLQSKIKNKASKHIADSDLYRSSKHQKRSIREPRLGTSSSMKDSVTRPFLRRHSSTGSRPPKPVSGNEPTRKKGFWLRHWRE